MNLWWWWLILLFLKECYFNFNIITYWIKKRGKAYLVIMKIKASEHSNACCRPNEISIFELKFNNSKDLKWKECNNNNNNNISKLHVKTREKFIVFEKLDCNLL
jgi:hypothetical protein